MKTADEIAKELRTEAQRMLTIARLLKGKRPRRRIVRAA